MTKRKRARPAPQKQPYELAAEAMTAAGQEPKGHHLVPRFYLERWAVNDRIRVTDMVNDRRTFELSPSKAARVNDFYRLEDHEAGDQSPVVYEAWLSEIEGKAAGVIAQILEDGINSMSAQQHSNLCHFVGMQITRTHAARIGRRSVAAHGLAHLSADGHDGALRQFLVELGREPTPQAVRDMRNQLPEMIADPMKFPLSRMEDLRMSGISGGHAAMFIGNRNFAIYETTRALITCDEPVIELAEDMGVHPEIGALWGAPIYVFPLDPHHVLAMFRRDLPAPGPIELTTAETLELNAVIAGSARHYAFSRPSDKLATKIYLPPPAAPGASQIHKNPADATSELIQFWTPKRWHGDERAPVRPVEHWWPAVVPSPPIPTPDEREMMERQSRER